MSDTNNFSMYPICDTDIWVNISLGKMWSELFARYNKIIIADVVEGEILKWNRTNSKFSFIAEKYMEYKEKGNILVINHDQDILKEDRGILERQLYELGSENDFKNRPPENRKGEFVSAIYADYFMIPLMKRNDNDFQEGGRGKIAFPDLEVKNWYYTIEELISDPKMRINIRRNVDNESRKMSTEKEAFKVRISKNEQDSISDMLKKLQSKFNSK